MAGILSELNTEEGVNLFVCLEHAYKQSNGTYEAKLAPGTYECIRGTHSLLHGDPFETFEVVGLPGHTGLLFHQGNYNTDSDGCVLVGEEFSGFDAITNSRKSFASFMKLLDGLNSFTLVVI